MLTEKFCTSDVLIACAFALIDNAANAAAARITFFIFFGFKWLRNYLFDEANL
jgi:hypothetical protein